MNLRDTYAKETGQHTLSAGSYVVLKYDAILCFSRKCVSARSGGKRWWQSCWRGGHDTFSDREQVNNVAGWWRKRRSERGVY